MNRYDLAGRVAIVTGGARGIGYGVARRLLQSGARVALWDIDEAAAGRASVTLAAEGGPVIAVGVDLTDAVAIDRAIAATLGAFGHLDILVNNAGIAGSTVPLVEYPVDEWRRIIEVDLVGVFLCCRAAVPHLRTRDWARIVNVASVAGKEGNPNMSAYSAAKAGVIALTKSLGKELASTGVRVNCVTPATVKTEIFAQMSQAQIDYMLARIPIGRFGTVEENANMITWLCTEDCSFSTGAVFDTSGGRCTY
ncbi:MAG: SDR family oxidoreductase [Gammaproteobacteria bacterium]|nr:MAG: SDR family oxidoreductase [Gammaproteobacteria bacterium]